MAEQEQIACVFCGKSVLRERLNLASLKNYDVSWVVLQKRRILAGPGRGKKGKNVDSGFPAIKDAGLSIVEMAANPSYAEIVEAIKDRLLMIVRAYLKAGIIDQSELVPTGS